MRTGVKASVAIASAPRVWVQLGSLEAMAAEPSSEPTVEEGGIMKGDGTIERAFEIARSGTCRNVEDIRKRLKREGYSDARSHLDGPAIRKQLADLIRGKQ